VTLGWISGWFGVLDWLGIGQVRLEGQRSLAAATTDDRADQYHKGVTQKHTNQLVQRFTFARQQTVTP